MNIQTIQLSVRARSRTFDSLPRQRSSSGMSESDPHASKLEIGALAAGA